MPRGKDFVSIGNKVHVQKRLLLSNLKELYVAYKERYPDHKIGLSKLCEIRPKWCVTVSPSDTHSGCVCTHHENTKLLVDCFCSVAKPNRKRIPRNQRTKTEKFQSLTSRARTWFDGYGSVRYHQSRMHGASLQELSWIFCSRENHQQVIYRIRDWWGDVIQPVRKRWQNNTTVLTTSQHTPSSQKANSASQTEERRNNRDKVYHSLGLYWKLSLCGARPGISLEQELVYHASCGDIFQEG